MYSNDDNRLTFDFLAHLSRGRIAKIIEKACLCRPLSVVRRRQHFQTSSPLDPLSQFKPNFIWRLDGLGEIKFVQMIMVT